MNIYVRLMGEHIEIAFRDHFQRKCQFLCLLLLLLLQFLMQIDERRRINGIPAVEVVCIDLRQAAVDNRLVHGFELARTAHDLFDKGQHELALCNQRVRRIAVAQR